MFIANFMLLLMNMPLVGLFVRVLQVPARVLMPAVAMISFVGIYGISGSTFDLLMMVGFGVAGYLLRKMDVPLVPVILGILLGNQMEDNLRRALTISDGQWSILWGSPRAIGLWVFAIAGFVAPMVIGRFVRPKVPARLADATGVARFSGRLRWNSPCYASSSSARLFIWMSRP